MNNILYHSKEQGVIICIDSSTPDVWQLLKDNNSYPIVLERSARTRFRLLANGSFINPQALPWQKKIISEVFRKELGFKVAPSLYKNEFYILGKKAKFQFLLQYGE